MSYRLHCGNVNAVSCFNCAPVLGSGIRLLDLSSLIVLYCNFLLIICIILCSTDLSGLAVNVFRSIKLQKSYTSKTVAKTSAEWVHQSPEGVHIEVNLQEACYIGVCATCWTLSDSSEWAMTHFLRFYSSGRCFYRKCLTIRMKLISSEIKTY